MKRTVSLLALLLVMALPAMALPIPSEPWYDPITHPAQSNAELNLYQIVNLLYGTSYTSNAAMEFAAISSSIFSGQQTLVAEAKYAGHNPQEMGWYQPVGAGPVTTYTPLLSVSGKGVAGFPGNTLAGTLSSTFNPAGPFGFYLESPQNSGNNFYSESWRNAGADHLVIYDLGTLVGAPHANRYLLGWEDVPYSQADKDYNDLVVELTSVVPEPASMLLLGLGIAGMVVRKRFRAQTA
ncbi:MAG TPA: DUF4114 domain-containing protein [Candidatus Hydrogenedentes bacterium]|nr:DUF4114 domain-containing protein [Candidatus Hydrogenedentota bacterium]HOS03464.1 DUF4114 domain-containing protein [Candidatus Hydrogenedentota bacterium]